MPNTFSWGPFNLYGLTAWIGNYIHYEVWDEITYPFPNFNCTKMTLSLFISLSMLLLMGSPAASDQGPLSVNLS